MSDRIKNTITEDMLPSMQGVIPSVIASCSSAGIPNVSYVSQVYYVDETHVAISHQFFNKTVRNVKENPVVCAIVTCPIDYVMRKFMLKFVESQNTGHIFEQMEMQLAAIASMSGKEDVFVLQYADIYKITSIETLG